ncbi:MAG: hypothetical protein JNL12_01205 [Planctomycetes bacterium]|nr:hypothetical protein [Planctomycetota bacterium]
MRTLLLSLVCSFPVVARGQSPANPPATPPASRLPVREVTVFKDGHAHVVREQPLPADTTTVVIDELPVPVLGTFWPYATGGATLVHAKAGRSEHSVDVPAVDLRQLVRANLGKDVVVLLQDERIDGRVLGVPVRNEASPGDGELVLLQTASGTRAVPMSGLHGLEVRGEFAGRLRETRTQERLELRVQGGGAGAAVGVVYVQKGLRWIPAYKLEIDGAGKAVVKFEATLVNDLVDLEGVTVNLVVGVPKFEFEGLLDPISLQHEMAQVAAAGRDRHESRNVFANSMMTQSVAGPSSGETLPTAGDGSAAEDLFVFPVRDVTLKKGERLVLPLRTFELGYRDVYVLDVPFAPPAEVRQGLHGERLVELARQLAAPKARHVLRLQNGTDAPLTTAPVLVSLRGQLLAQARMTYTSKGRSVDVEINPAIDVRVETDEVEASRDAGPIRFGDENYARVDVRGVVRLWNGKPVPVTVEVTRRVLGLCDEVGQQGEKKQLDLVRAWHGDATPGWWGWWNWPHWWFQRNGFGEFRWQVELAPGAQVQLDAGWHYFWR